MKVRLYETDANGHMSQATYFGYQEWAFSEYWTACGFPELVGSQVNTSLFMGEQYCRFVSELSYWEPVRMGVRCARLGRSSLTLEYVFLHPDGSIAAVGGSGIVHVEVATRRALPIPDGLRQAIERIEGGG